MRAYQSHICVFIYVKKEIFQIELPFRKSVPKDCDLNFARNLSEYYQINYLIKNNSFFRIVYPLKFNLIDIIINFKSGIFQMDFGIIQLNYNLN